MGRGAAGGSLLALYKRPGRYQIPGAEVVQRPLAAERFVVAKFPSMEAARACTRRTTSEREHGF